MVKPYLKQMLRSGRELNIGSPSASSPSTQLGGSVVPTKVVEPDTAVTGSNVRTDFTAFDPVKGILYITMATLQ
jgi:hypothetical protein